MTEPISSQQVIRDSETIRRFIARYPAEPLAHQLQAVYQNLLLKAIHLEERKTVPIDQGQVCPACGNPDPEQALTNDCYDLRGCGIWKGFSEDLR